jgi:hypothetical protein
MIAELFGSTEFNAAGFFCGIAFSTDGSDLLAVTSGKEQTRVRSFAASDGRLLGESLIEGAWSRLAVLPDGSWILSAATDAIRVSPAGKTMWKVTSEARAGGSVALSPDGTLLSICGNKKCSVFGTADGKRRFDTKAIGKEIFASAFSSDGL